ncbi:MAG: hypothetical protein BWX95_02654 [Bacteroidetes bacterium ADurb.Bin141]|nr:MAG: hypothetical protein BWX95_02654 [Bacteroidetes bacterium ADurb.Bin141]
MRVLPKNSTDRMTTSAISTMIKAYSTSPCPFSEVIDNMINPFLIRYKYNDNSSITIKSAGVHNNFANRLRNTSNI